MLIFNPTIIGNKLYELRKKRGLTQAEVAEAAEISDRAYADIERGTANMRVSTLLKICEAFHITPNDILVKDETEPIQDEDLFKRINDLESKNKNTALELLSIYLKSIE